MRSLGKRSGLVSDWAVRIPGQSPWSVCARDACRATGRGEPADATASLNTGLAPGLPPRVAPPGGRLCTGRPDTRSASPPLAQVGPNSRRGKTYRKTLDLGSGTSAEDEHRCLARREPSPRVRTDRTRHFWAPSQRQTRETPQQSPPARQPAAARRQAEDQGAKLSRAPPPCLRRWRLSSRCPVEKIADSESSRESVRHPWRRLRRSPDRATLARSPAAAPASTAGRARRHEALVGV